MSGLMIRLGDESGLLRSTGDPPNGIISLSSYGEWHFIVQTHGESKASKQTGIQVALRVGEGDPEEMGTAEPLEPRQAVDACAGLREAEGLWKMTVDAVHIEVQTGLASFNPRLIGPAVAFAIEVADALEANGYIERGSGA